MDDIGGRVNFRVILRKGVAKAAQTGLRVFNLSEWEHE